MNKKEEHTPLDASLSSQMRVVSLDDVMDQKIVGNTMKRRNHGVGNAMKRNHNVGAAMKRRNHGIGNMTKRNHSVGTATKKRHHGVGTVTKSMLTQEVAGDASVTTQRIPASQVTMKDAHLSCVRLDYGDRGPGAPHPYPPQSPVPPTIIRLGGEMDHGPPHAASPPPRSHGHYGELTSNPYQSSPEFHSQIDPHLLMITSKRYGVCHQEVLPFLTYLPRVGGLIVNPHRLWVRWLEYLMACRILMSCLPEVNLQWQKILGARLVRSLTAFQHHQCPNIFFQDQNKHSLLMPCTSNMSILMKQNVNWHKLYMMLMILK